MTAEWAVAELKFANLGDRRSQKRLVRMVSDLASQPHASMPQASGDWAATQAAYDFWASPRIKAEAIRQAHQRSTRERIKPHPIVLAIQDTTELNFSRHLRLFSSQKARKFRVINSCLSQPLRPEPRSPELDCETWWIFGQKRRW